MIIVRKPLVTIDTMITLLKSKNIKFNYITENEAKIYLKKNNNYFNITSYKYNFLKHTGINKYIDLDFAYLKDLAIIDFRLRILIFEMIINIEHYLKMSILNDFEELEEDGYKTVNKFLENDYQNDCRVNSNILKKLGKNGMERIITTYTKGKARIQDVPIWEFLEIITFGELVYFYEFYSKYHQINNNLKKVYMLYDIVKLRNAVAHNNCILNDLTKKIGNNIIDYDFSAFLTKCGIGKDTKKNKMSNDRIRQISYTIFLFDDIVTSEGIKEHIYKSVNHLMYDRMLRNSEYYVNNEIIKSVYNFFDKIIINIIPCDYFVRSDIDKEIYV